MNTTLIRASAAALAVLGLALAPTAATAAPASLELATGPVLTAPGNGSVATPQISVCQGMWWFRLFC